MRELARLTGTTESTLVASRYWTRLRADAAQLSDEPDGRRLVKAADTIERCHGAETLEIGAWHGDWGHWNMGVGRGVLQVWDWERFDDAVPVGFDGLHFLAERVRPGEREERRQEDEFHRSVSRTLSELGVRVDHHDLTLSLYLLEMAVRYVRSLRFDATPALKRRTNWVMSLLEHRPKLAQPPLVKGRS
jgi:hypothetical protein